MGTYCAENGNTEEQRGGGERGAGSKLLSVVSSRSEHDPGSPVDLRPAHLPA